MLCSMTGFGRGEAQGNDVAVSVELRSVNNRFLDLQVRAPREYAALESEVQRTLKAAFKRGRIEVVVRRTALRTRYKVHADDGLLSAYLKAMDDLAEQTGRPLPPGFALQHALSQQGVLEARAADIDAIREGDVLGTALEAAVHDLSGMRTAEGKALHADLMKHLMALLDEVDGVESVASEVDQKMQRRLEARMRRLLDERPEPWRIVQEAALLAEKSDVSEEVTRLRSHALQFREAMEAGGAVGRRLEFLLQEMNREVNTIGSKSSDHPISHRVVQMKAVLERMREQAANVE